MVTYNYLLTRWQWETDEHGPAWNAPATPAGCIDLRPVPAQDLAGGTPEGWLFGAWDGTAPSGILLASGADMREFRVSARERDAWESTLGYRPQGDTLADCLFDCLTTGADPTGDAGPRPLRPNSRGDMILAMGGHSRVRRERFRWGHHPHTNQVQACVHGSYRKLMGWVEAGLLAEEHLRRVLGGWVRKYGLMRSGEWRELVPREFLRGHPGPLRPRSKVSDDFNRANESLDAGNWTEVVGDWSIVTNEVQCDSTSQSAARYETDLDSDDHYAQISVTGNSGTHHVGVDFRFNSGNEERYCAHVFSTNLRVAKFGSTGTRTNLDSDKGISVSHPDPLRAWINVDNLVTVYDGIQKHNFTDTSFDTNLRCGLHMNAADSGDTLDDFEAADLEIVVTFDADGTNSGFSNSDADGQFFDDCNDAHDGSSADYVEGAASHGPGTTTSELWLSLEDVPADFDSMDQFEAVADVVISAAPGNDTLTTTIQIFDSDSGGTENALTDAQTIVTEADGTTRLQRLVTFGSLTGTKAQWNNAHAKVLQTYTRTGADDGFASRLFGLLFYGLYTAAGAEPGQDQPSFISAGLSRPRRVVPRSLGV